MEYKSWKNIKVVVKKANKDHDCGACSGQILKGEKYTHTTGKWDGAFAHIKHCGKCAEVKE